MLEEVDAESDETVDLPDGPGSFDDVEYVGQLEAAYVKSVTILHIGCLAATNAIDLDYMPAGQPS